MDNIFTQTKMKPDNAKQENSKTSILSSDHALPKPRDYMFDNMKALLIYLVVIGHLIDTYHVPSKYFTVMYYFIYFFHMPAFIFITGYFSKNLDKCRETAFEKFLVPYILLNLFSYIQNLFIYNGNDAPNFIVFQAPLGGWFLFAIFIWKILLKDIVRIRFVVPLAFLFGLLSPISPEFEEYMALGRIAAFTCFFLLGYFTTQKHIDMVRKIPKIISIIALIGVVCLAFYYVMGDIMPKGPILFRKPYRRSAITEDLQFRMILYGIAILMIGILINLMNNKKNIFTCIGGKTFTVYIVHLFIIRVLDEHVFFEHEPLLYTIYVFGGAALITFLCSRKILMVMYDNFINFVCSILFKDYNHKKLN